MTRLEKLKALEARLEGSLAECESKELASLARQYRETIREIEEIEGTKDDDELGELLKGREANGQSNAVR